MSIRPDHSFLNQIALQPAQEAPPAEDMQVGDIAKIRYETFSPIEEYEVRDGRTEPLDEEFHAVLSNDYRGSGTVTANGILIKAADLVGPANVREGVTYWHPDSNLCNRVADGPLQVNYTFNPARPEVVHLWSLQWVYLETLPSKIKAPMLDSAALAAAAKEHKRQIKRFTDHVQQLHTDDSVRAINELSHNRSEMDRVAVSLPLPETAQPVAREQAPAAEVESFEAARRDTGIILDQTRQTRRLIDQAEADHIALQQHRRSTAPVASAVIDPLDAL